ncbi:MAG: HD domain-containing protein [Treponema sp.]
MLNKRMVLTLFEAFSIERWNDLVRPFRPMEMDKVAEKMFLAFIIGKYEEKCGNKINWNKIITHSVFGLLQKIALSDIKAPIQYLIRTSYPEEYKKINKWIFDKYSPLIDNKKFLELFESYLFDVSKTKTKEDEILIAAHQYASLRELEMLKPCNEEFRLKDILISIEKDVDSFKHLKAVNLLLQKDIPYKFITKIEQLRFQVRWNQSPRIPLTSVLGHSYFVAVLTLLMCYDLDLSNSRIYNNFFCGLFHDLPEAVTRDIISPVKQATNSLPEVVKEIESKVVEEELLPLIDDSYKDEILYYIQDEFENRIKMDGKVKIIENYMELNTKYSDEIFKATDGRLVRFADHIAAFIEAYSSIQFGITSNQLENGKKGIITQYPVGTKINGLDVERFFGKFRQN